MSTLKGPLIRLILTVAHMMTNGLVGTMTYSVLAAVVNAAFGGDGGGGGGS